MVSSHRGPPRPSGIRLPPLAARRLAARLEAHARWRADSLTGANKGGKRRPRYGAVVKSTPQYLELRRAKLKNHRLVLEKSLLDAKLFLHTDLEAFVHSQGERDRMIVAYQLNRFQEPPKDHVLRALWEAQQQALEGLMHARGMEPEKIKALKKTVFSPVSLREKLEAEQAVLEARRQPMDKALITERQAAGIPDKFTLETLAENSPALKNHPGFLRALEDNYLNLRRCLVTDEKLYFLRRTLGNRLDVGEEAARTNRLAHLEGTRQLLRRIWALKKAVKALDRQAEK